MTVKVNCVWIQVTGERVPLSPSHTWILRHPFYLNLTNICNQPFNHLQISVPLIFLQSCLYRRLLQMCHSSSDVLTKKTCHYHTALKNYPTRIISLCFLYAVFSPVTCNDISKAATTLKTRTSETRFWNESLFYSNSIHTFQSKIFGVPTKEASDTEFTSLVVSLSVPHFLHWPCYATFTHTEQ